MNLILFLTVFLFVGIVQGKIEVRQGKIFLDNEKPFESKLEMMSFELGDKKVQLKETGYILANSQSIYLHDQFVSKWITLSDVSIKENNLNLDSIKPDKGLAYGVMATSIDFEKEINVGQDTLINRYGLSGDNIKARVIKVEKQPFQDIIKVHFLASHAEELIAGTSCEVTIKDIHFQSYKVSLLSLLHIGLEDYIVIKGKDGGYFPKHVTVIDQDATTALVIVPVSQDLPYVSRGAILLKPLLNNIIHPHLE